MSLLCPPAARGIPGTAACASHPWVFPKGAIPAGGSEASGRAELLAHAVFPCRGELPHRHRHDRHGAGLEQPQQRRGGHGGHHEPAGGRCGARRPRGLQRPALAPVNDAPGTQYQSAFTGGALQSVKLVGLRGFYVGIS